jgi:hypothetical protein
MGSWPEILTYKIFSLWERLSSRDQRCYTQNCSRLESRSHRKKNKKTVQLTPVGLIRRWRQNPTIMQFRH